MSRFPLPFSFRFARAALLTVALCGVCASGSARADEFSLLPVGDPIYAQLSSLSRAGEAPHDAKTAAQLTRYEAALQTARAILDVQNRDAGALSRAQWRALKSLTLALKGELRQLGVDVDDALARIERNLKTDAPRSASVSAPTAPVAESGPSVLDASALSQSAFGQSASGGLLAPGATGSSALELPLSQRLRVGAALSPGARGGESASQGSLAFDLNPSLTLRAITGRRDLGGADDSPLLTAPLFAGATGATAAGGGLDVTLAPGLKFSTEVERLRASTGVSGARIGGGASLSTWQNRLSMSMNLSRLLPEDATVLPATAAQLGIGLGVTQRLSLGLLYQGLFTQSANNASRVSGGVNLSF